MILPLRFNDRDAGEPADGRHAGFIWSSRLDGLGNFATPMAISRAGPRQHLPESFCSLSREQTQPVGAAGDIAQASDWNKVPHGEFCFRL